jgi:hypothetical protein
MYRYLSRTIFGADFAGAKAITGAYKQKNASDIGFKEDWLQRAIAENIELVLGPCIRPDTRSRYAVPPHLRFPKSAASLSRA